MCRQNSRGRWRRGQLTNVICLPLSPATKQQQCHQQTRSTGLSHIDFLTAVFDTAEHCPRWRLRGLIEGGIQFIRNSILPLT